MRAFSLLISNPMRGVENSRMHGSNVPESGFCVKKAAVTCIPQRAYEPEMTELLICGKSYKEISEKWFVSFDTVRNHVYSIYQILGVSSRAQFVHVRLET